MMTGSEGNSFCRGKFKLPTFFIRGGVWNRLSYLNVLTASLYYKAFEAHVKKLYVVGTLELLGISRLLSRERVRRDLIHGVGFGCRSSVPSLCRLFFSLPCFSLKKVKVNGLDDSQINSIIKFIFWDCWLVKCRNFLICYACHTKVLISAFLSWPSLMCHFFLAQKDFSLAKRRIILFSIFLVFCSQETLVYHGKTISAGLFICDLLWKHSGSLRFSICWML